MSHKNVEPDQNALSGLVSELGSEKYVVERIRAEMVRKEWSQAELSRRMEAAVQEGRNGGVLNQAVLSKLLRGDRGRHISIEQLITLARVFEVPLGELLLPPSAVDDARGWRYFHEAAAIENEIREKRTSKREKLGELQRLLRASPELRKSIREYRDAYYERNVAQVMPIIEREQGSGLSQSELDAELAAYGVLEVPVIAVADELLKGTDDE